MEFALQTNPDGPIVLILSEPWVLGDHLHLSELKITQIDGPIRIAPYR